jgi:hypothetical protein
MRDSGDSWRHPPDEAFPKRAESVPAGVLGATIRRHRDILMDVN